MKRPMTLSTTLFTISLTHFLVRLPDFFTVITTFLDQQDRCRITTGEFYNGAIRISIINGIAQFFLQSFDFFADDKKIFTLTGG